MHDDITPYSKREIDEWRTDVKEQLDRIEDTTRLNSKTTADLAKIASHNSGQIIALWAAHEGNKKAADLIMDIKAFAGVTKWIVYTIITLGALYSALKGEILVKIITYLFK